MPPPSAAASSSSSSSSSSQRNPATTTTSTGTATPRNANHSSKASTTTTGGSSKHRSSPSLSAFFNASPSLLWRRASELESSVGSSDSNGTKMSTSSSMTRRKAGSSGSGGGGGDDKSSSGSNSTKKTTTTTAITTATRSPLFWQKNYLVAYNLVSAVLWAAVLGRVLLLAPIVGFEHVYDGVGEYAKWVQTGALLEVVHSLTGLVRAPLATTAMQVASRILLVWGVVDRHPEATSGSVFYSSMLVAWSVTEVIRYGYFVMNLKGGGGVPRLLVWLRYNTFFVLYPLGITSEVAEVWKASNADDTVDLERWALWAILGVYVPGSYVLYTHMMAQRRKVMRAASRPRVDSVKSAEYTR